MKTYRTAPGPPPTPLFFAFGNHPMGQAAPKINASFDASNALNDPFSALGARCASAAHP
ncbi:hypothetical protein GCM10022247_39830 [Allokutzneria multivorans]|uniref:Uncharacterized protein n=1 Tax=Allokutzneria multivorans TaxID=1142134 RepID=A0ABP7SL92_9PSEU